MTMLPPCRAASEHAFRRHYFSPFAILPFAAAFTLFACRVDAQRHDCLRALLSLLLPLSSFLLRYA
jgi:hypothetical protein